MPATCCKTNRAVRCSSIALLAICVLAGACELLIALNLRPGPHEQLWCPPKSPNCARLSAELSERPWSYERISRVCATLAESRSACEVTWTMHHDLLDRQFYNVYVVLSVLVIAMSCALLVAVLNSNRKQAEPQPEEQDSSVCV